MRAVTLATCTLNQWAMDFKGNYERILQTIIEAKEKGASYRCGPELEVTGYGCADHFYESDTFLHSWEVIAKIMEDKRCSNIIIDIGMPVQHKNVAYNCRVIFLNKKLLLIRPKKKLCDNGLYRESRWFTGWMKEYQVEYYKLPKVIQNISGQLTVPIGDAVICTPDTSIGFEICEELWNPDSSLIKQSYSGIEITVNSSGGFHEIGRTKDVINVIKSATNKCGGVYLFSNLRGCDGDLVYYHGTSHITLNGTILALGEQFSLKDIEVVIATLDLEDVVSYRRNICKSTSQIIYPQIEVDWHISVPNVPITTPITPASLQVYEEGQELALGPACWLWDYLRRSNSNGIILPLEGDLDSCSSAVIVYSMCSLVCKAIESGNLSVLSDLRKIVNDSTYKPSNPKELCNLILITCHLGATNVNDEKIDSNELALEIGSSHYNIPLEKIIHSIINILLFTCSKLFNSRYCCQDVLALPSNTGRIKMIILYIISEIISLSRQYPSRILVLGVGNADSALLGNFVKYGNFSGDLSLTAGINKKNLKLFLKYSKHYFKLKSLDEILSYDAKNSSAISRIPLEGELQELHELSKLKGENCGLYTTFCKLASKHSNKSEVSKRVKHFFYLISVYRHKNYSIAPCLHLGSYATVNNYYKQYQILYNTNWTWQYDAIDREVHAFEKSFNSGYRNINVK